VHGGAIDDQVAGSKPVVEVLARYVDMIFAGVRDCDDMLAIKQGMDSDSRFGNTVQNTVFAPVIRQ
jgi:hypothetical protein